MFLWQMAEASEDKANRINTLNGSTDIISAEIPQADQVPWPSLSLESAIHSPYTGERH